MPALNHIHTYTKFKKRPGYWRCAHPQCTHYLSNEEVNGKLSACNNCTSGTFLMDRDAMRRIKPICLNCSNTEKAKAYRKAKELVGNVLGNLTTSETS